jgi:hypothetical protein
MRSGMRLKSDSEPEVCGRDPSQFGMARPWRARITARCFCYGSSTPWSLATEDLESKGAIVTGIVMKAVLHLLSAMAVLYVCDLFTPEGSATLYRLPI